MGTDSRIARRSVTVVIPWIDRRGRERKKGRHPWQRQPQTKSLSGVTLAWDPNTETDLAGYRIYYGLESRNYASTVDVGNRTSYTLTDLTPEKVYYFAAKAYNSAGQESSFSNEISYFYNSSGKIVTISPNDEITGNTPTFSWYAVPGYSHYVLGAKDIESIKFLKIYSAEECGCASGEVICSMPAPTPLLDGPCKWAVRPRNSDEDRWSLGVKSFPFKIN